jgi:ubiquinone/menaquinone biosynthesis C-methylase UbiE
VTALPTIARGFRDVDAQMSSGGFSAYLARARMQLATHKSASYDLLEARPGQRLIDIGCGTGEDARALVERVGPTGVVVGVDVSASLIAEARRRHAGCDASVHFVVGDAHALAIPDACFDAARVERALQHMERPAAVLAEMRRLVRPGGVLVASEPDWDTLVIDSAERELTRAIARSLADGHIRNGWMGRQLPGLFARLGLDDVDVHPVTIALRSHGVAMDVLNVHEVAVAVGARRRSAVTAWLGELEERAACGHFFAALTGFTVRGRVPTRPLRALPASRGRVRRVRMASGPRRRLQG